MAADWIGGDVAATYTTDGNRRHRGEMAPRRTPIDTAKMTRQPALQHANYTRHEGDQSKRAVLTIGAA